MTFLNIISVKKLQRHEENPAYSPSLNIRMGNIMLLVSNRAGQPDPSAY
jgi:hypothetical protein